MADSSISLHAAVALQSSDESEAAVEELTIDEKPQVNAFDLVERLARESERRRRQALESRTALKRAQVAIQKSRAASRPSTARTLHQCSPEQTPRVQSARQRTVHQQYIEDGSSDDSDQDWYGVQSRIQSARQRQKRPDPKTYTFLVHEGDETLRAVKGWTAEKAPSSTCYSESKIPIATSRRTSVASHSSIAWHDPNSHSIDRLVAQREASMASISSRKHISVDLVPRQVVVKHQATQTKRQAPHLDQYVQMEQRLFAQLHQLDIQLQQFMAIGHRQSLFP